VIAMVWVGLGGFLGANARYFLGGWVAGRLGTVFPYGTFVINITGSFILGLFLAFVQDRAWVHPGARLLFAIGFLGAYTTFSTFTYETIALVENGELLLAAINALGSVTAGLTAVFAGIALGRAI
jgi:fluoride exporter